ncbi:hypothetical protein [Chromohalobacter canadensis]|jgi:hypothetical protein|uniref:hypothetical protein n=1 Tax=Chromohalobacter canadensis TaxID=141389 RepID=UPI00118055B1|nr:hypothetical protein [Chromohalobacter canadensis]
MKDFPSLVESYKKSFSDAKTILGERGIYLSESEIYEYLLESPDIDEHENLILKEMSAEYIADSVGSQYRENAEPEVVDEVEFPESILPSGIPVFRTSQQVKIKGEKWVIHKNDADPFPSNPHAHNYQENLVVHLGNGMVYRRRKHVGKLSKKKLMLLRSEIKHVDLPDFTA